MSDQRPAPTLADIRAELLRLMSEVLGQALPRLPDDTPILDLVVSSLMLVEGMRRIYERFGVLISIRRAHIRVEYSVSWLAGAVALLILSRSRALLEMAAVRLGIEDPLLVLMLLAGVSFLLVFFRFSAIISKLKDDNIALAQRVAILEYYLRSRSGPGNPVP